MIDNNYGHKDMTLPEAWAEKVKRYDVEENEQWREWANKIPFIKWPATWEVKSIPPFGGAMIRYLVNTPKAKGISIYLDCYERLGFFGGPHWEVYPVDDNNERVAIDDVKGLLALIRKARR